MQTRFQQRLQTMFMHDETGKLVPSPTYEQDAEAFSALVKTASASHGDRRDYTMQVARFGAFAGGYAPACCLLTSFCAWCDDMVRVSATTDYLLLGDVHRMAPLRITAISHGCSRRLSSALRKVPRDSQCANRESTTLRQRISKCGSKTRSSGAWPRRETIRSGSRGGVDLARPEIAPVDTGG